MKKLLLLTSICLFGAGCIPPTNDSAFTAFVTPGTLYRQVEVYDGKEALVRGIVRIRPAVCTLKACVMDNCAEGERQECNDCGASALLEDEETGEQILLEDISCSVKEIWVCGGDAEYDFVSCDQRVVENERFEARGIVREQFAGPIHLEAIQLIRPLEDFE